MRNIKPIAIKLIYESINVLSKGHLSMLFYMHSKLYDEEIESTSVTDFANKKDIIEYNFKINNMAEYLSAAIIEFTDPITLTFDKERYFNEVYSHNVDVWGFLTIYFTFYEYIQSKFNNISITHYTKNKFLYLIRSIFEQYLFNHELALKPINVNNLILNLKQLNNILLNDKTSTVSNHSNIGSRYTKSSLKYNLLTRDESDNLKDSKLIKPNNYEKRMSFKKSKKNTNTHHKIKKTKKNKSASP